MRNFLYERWYNYTPAIPLLLALLCSYFIFVSPGIRLGVEFRGGVLITVYTKKAFDTVSISKKLVALGLQDLSVRTLSGIERGFEVEFALDERIEKSSKLLEEARKLRERGMEREAIEKAREAMLEIEGFVGKVELEGKVGEVLKKANDALGRAKEVFRSRVLETIMEEFPEARISVREVGATLSARFLDQSFRVILLSFALMALIIFIIFKSPFASFVVLFATFINALIALGLMALFQIPLTLASFAGLLAVVGYSIDDDILLASRLIRERSPAPEEDTFAGLLTGLAMNFAGLTSFGVLLALAIVTSIDVYYQIGAVSSFGIVADMITTWFINGVMVLNYARRRVKR